MLRSAYFHNCSNSTSDSLGRKGSSKSSFPPLAGEEEILVGLVKKGGGKREKQKHLK